MDPSALLFDNFAYGMTRPEIEERLGATSPAGRELDRWTLAAPGGAAFLGEKWEEIFSFDNKGGLRQIILVRPAGGADGFFSVQEALIKEGWEPAAAEADDEAFDAFGQNERGDQAALKKALAGFESRALQNGKDVTVYFFPSEFAGKALKNLKIKFWANAMDKAGENFCLLSLMAGADNIRLSFTAPLLSRKAALQYGSMIKR